MRVSRLLAEISRNLAALNRKMDRVEALLLGKLKLTVTVNETELLSLPDYLRKTYLAAIKLDDVTASRVAAMTRRSRAVESKYLNQLVLMQKLEKRHDGRKVVFYKAAREGENNNFC